VWVDRQVQLQFSKYVPSSFQLMRFPRPAGGTRPAHRQSLGVEKAPIDFSSEGLTHRVRIGSDIEIAVED
jgi:hypothetical protein